MAEERRRGFFSRLFGVEEEPAAEAPTRIGDVGQEAEGPDADRPIAPVRPDPDLDVARARPVSEEEAGQAFTPPEEVRPPGPAPSVADSSVPPELEQLPTDAAITPPPFIPAGSALPESKTAQPVGWLQRLRTGLSRSSDALSSGITGVFTRRKLDRETLQDLEDVLIQADLGVETATAIASALTRDRFDRDISPEEVRGVMAAEIEKVLAPAARPLDIDRTQKPFVILMVGVNGSGKTTTIGKLAAKFRATGHTVMLAAGDTFRAAAIEQLKIWGERSGAPVITRAAGTDAAGLAFDAMVEARKAGTDILLIDTAGRLQNKAELMAELAKVIRVIRKHDASAPHAVLLTLDATTGQNAVNQVDVFRAQAGVTGLVMTKLDGTARGGILVALTAKYGLPVHYIGVGETIDDLEPFVARDFAQAIAGLD